MQAGSTKPVNTGTGDRSKSKYIDKGTQKDALQWSSQEVEPWDHRELTQEPGGENGVSKCQIVSLLTWSEYSLSWQQPRLKLIKGSRER
jgi:hypothetical protein